jgi:hypothetical protein
MSSKLWLLLPAALLLAAPPKPSVSLRADSESIVRGQSATLRWTSSSAERAVIEPEVGTVSVSGSATVKPDHSTTYTITVYNKSGQSSSAQFEVQVIPADGERETTKGLDHYTGHQLLGPNDKEDTGQNGKNPYGLYSYLLLGSKPSPAEKPRYLKVIEACLAKTEEVKDLEVRFERKQINILYIPVRQTPPAGIPDQELPAKILEDYDYARAQQILQSLPGTLLHGPYFVSRLAAPIEPGQRLPKPYMFQDLSGVLTDTAAYAWVEFFLKQAGQPKPWTGSTAETFSFKVRDFSQKIGAIMPEIPAALGTAIQWLKP